MKKLLAITLFAFSVVFSSLAQEGTPMHEFNKFMAKNLKYGTELRKESIEGPVTISLNIDENGELKNQPELVAGNEKLAEEVFASFDKMEESGFSQYIDQDLYGKEVLVSVEFYLSKGKKTGLNIPKPPVNEKTELEKLNKAIAENPYFPNYYKKRAEFYEFMGKNVQAQLDTEYAELLDEKNITNIVVVGYQANDIQRKLKSE